MKQFKTYQLAIKFYRLSATLNLCSDAKDQFSRASRSIVLNLAEGRGRVSRKDQVRFYSIAMGSLRECQALLSLEQLEDTACWKALDETGAALYSLIKRAA